MKIVTSQEMSRLENLAYKEGSSEEHFMEQAGLQVAGVVQQFIAHHHLKPRILLLCGAGNNAGDAYVAGRVLLQGGFQVSALSCAVAEKRSPLCVQKSQEFTLAGGHIKQAEEGKSVVWGDTEVLIDGLLGTGFHGEIGGLLGWVIHAANASALPIIAIDIPSGIHGTKGEVARETIHATQTVCLGLPKIGCFYPKAWEHTGHIKVRSFGLHDRFIQQGNAQAHLIEDPLIRTLLPKILRTRHKYLAGYVVGIGGSPGMAGAPTMACLASLRAGAGIVRHFHPLDMKDDFSHAPLEIIHSPYQINHIEPILQEQQRANAFFLGPGMGKYLEAETFLTTLLPQIHKPCVIDAEALFIATSKRDLLPPQSILTPHHGEMKKILKLIETNIAFSELLQKSRRFVDEHQTTVILKGSPTYILHYNEIPFICHHGDPGMATAGSGDILCGIVAAFLAQVSHPLHAAILGVQFHAMAGEYAAEQWSSSSMIATDMLDHLSTVFKYYA